MLLAWLLGCPSPPPPADGSCADPAQYWPDADGDGVGESTSTYRGCSPPDGWVTEVRSDPVNDTYVWDTGPYVDSGHSGHTGWWSTGDTGWGWTADTAGTASQTAVPGPTAETGP